MSESKKPDESPDQSLADVPPTPVEATTEPQVGGFGRGLAIAAGGVVALVLVGSSVMPTAGATRSSKLEWERRQAEIEEAVRSADSASPSAVPSDNQQNSPSDAGENQ